MIQIFITGGTFDKTYNYLNGELFFEKTHLPEMLETSRCKLDIEVETLMMIDSLDMSKDDRTQILNSCTDCKIDQIVITHGTDTMVESATYVANARLNKTIVFTGAMIPIDFGSSDGLFNLGSAMGFVQSLSSGVYIAMIGRYFECD